MSTKRGNWSPEIMELECGCTYNATHTKGDRLFKCEHGNWIIRARTKIVHYYDPEFVPRENLFDSGLLEEL